jgi:hypothetical protein
MIRPMAKIIVGFLLLFSGTVAAQEPSRLLFFTEMPGEISGWGKTRPEYYYGKELYRFMDGGAELYLSFSERARLEHFAYRRDNEAIEVDIFDLQKPQNAFGVFSLSREKIENDFGQGSEYREGLLLFWKDRYYFSLTAYPETPEKKEAVFKLARLLEKATPRQGPLPDILKLLPAPGRREESVKYLRHPAWLASLCTLGESNPLEIRPGYEMALADYQEGYRVLLVSYPSAGKAARAEKKFDNWIAAAAFSGEESTCRISGCKRWGPKLVVILQAADETRLAELLKNVIEEKKK